MKYTPILLLAFFGVRCTDSAPTKHDSSNDSLVKTVDSTSQNRITDLEDWEEKTKRRNDSIHHYLDRILVDVLQTASQHKTDSFFHGKTDTIVYQFENIYATFEFGTIFSKDRKHLLVKRFTKENEGFETSLFSNIYILKDNRFLKLLSDTANIGYSKDNLEDINGDGFEDFVVSQYSGTGCCPRDLRTAYIYNQHNGDFEMVGLFNPEFDNMNKLIYEMEYGYPGYVSLSKSKWNGVSKVPLESISPTYSGERLDSFMRPYTYTKTIYPGEKTIILKAVPKEYKKLRHYEYFISYQR